MKAFAIKYKKDLAGIIAGAIAGFGYYHFVGCATGTCAITSNPIISTLYGAVMGLLVVSLFKNNKSEKQN